jgi:hypothetical protein
VVYLPPGDHVDDETGGDLAAFPDDERSLCRAVPEIRELLSDFPERPERYFLSSNAPDHRGNDSVMSMMGGEAKNVEIDEPGMRFLFQTSDTDNDILSFFVFGADDDPTRAIARFGVR